MSETPCFNVFEGRPLNLGGESPCSTSWDEEEVQTEIRCHFPDFPILTSVRGPWDRKHKLLTHKLCLPPFDACLPQGLRGMGLQSSEDFWLTRFGADWVKTFISCYRTPGPWN